jgi:HEAT repeat protein
MTRSPITALVLSVCCLAGPGLLSAQEPDSLLADELRLKAAFQATDNAGLVEFLRVRAQGAASRDKLAGLVTALEAKDANTRQKACTELVAIGLPAIPLLREAARDIDLPEKARSASQCLAAIEKDPGALVVSAARLLAGRRVAGTATVLLDYLPHAESDTVLNEVKEALTVVTWDRGKPDPAVLKALDDPHPLRRASAIVALCRGGVGEHRTVLRKLLQDPKPSVRLRASLALAQAADAKAVSTLITLLTELPPESLREVEAWLTELAGEQAPKVPFGADEASRARARDAWAKWWLDTEGPGLLEELKKRTLEEVDRDKALTLIEKLGDDNFDIRQKAEKELTSLGVQILPLLKQAAFKHAEIEIRKRAARCLDTIEKEKPIPLSPVTPRLIALRKPPGSVEAILRYLPFVEDDAMLQELQSALNTCAQSGGKVHTAILKALDDRVPVRRAAAGLALCSGPVAEHMNSLRKLLRDPDLEVRLKVALGLAHAGEPEAVPALIALIADLPIEQSLPAEDYLERLARDTAPKDLPEGEEGRKKRSQAWADWWTAHKDKVVMVDRFSPASRERYLGYTVLVQNGNSQVVELGADGKPRWTIGGLRSPWDAQVLPGNKVLIAEFSGNVVTERDLKGAILWQKTLTGNPLTAERLRSGTTFIATRNQLMEVDRSGREIWTINRPHDIMSARRLPNGQLVVITNNRQVIRMDRKGKELKTYLVPNVYYYTNEILDNGHILMPMGWMNQVVEYDTDGKEIHRWTVTQPNHAVRLPNGNILVVSQNFPFKAFEFDKKGKQVAEMATMNQVFRIRRR